MRFLTLPFLVLLSFASAGQSVLSTGEWFQFSVVTEGIYKISAGQLREAGLDVRKINPKNIKVYGGCFGMLPQANSAARINALQEMAITVTGEEDGVFNDEDYILFYGQNPDRFLFNPAKNLYDYQNNYFTDSNFYFLTAGDTPGKRIPTPPPVAGSFPVVSRFHDFVYEERDMYNLLNTGRQWFGEPFFRDKNVRTFDYNHGEVRGIVPNSKLYFVSQAVVKHNEFKDASFDISINGKLIKTQTAPPIANVPHEPIAHILTDTVAVNTSEAGSDGVSLKLTYEFKTIDSRDNIAASGYIDFYTFTFLRKLALYGDRTFFTCGESLQQAMSTFTVDQVGGQARVWDVTDPFNVEKQTLTLTGTTGSFNAATSTLKRFAVFDMDKTGNATFVKKVPNQDLASLRDIQYLVITHDTFLEQAKRLADHRASFNKIKTAAVTVDQIYNEFSGGKQDITALRDFIHSLYWSSNKGLKYVLLFGRGTYDYRNISQSGGNYVPIYESRESVSPKSSYASDDYLGMLAIDQGEWSEIGVPKIDTMAVGLGRIPCKSVEEAQNAADKIIEYETSPNRFGDWHSSFLFAADDGDSQLHMEHADKLAKKIETGHNEFIVKRLFLDYFEQPSNSGSQTSPAMSHAFAQAMEKGYAVINYTGHGAVNGLASERIVDADWIMARRNAPRYPFFFTATCDFGRNDNTIEFSGGETSLLMKGGGIIGLISSVRPVLASNNFKLNCAFYDALFKLDGNRYRPLGTIFKETKNKGVDEINGRNYMHLGDPGLTLAFPRPKITISSIGNANPPKLQALSPITVTGRVTADGKPLTNYNGNLRYLVFDRPVPTTTRGDQNDPFTYSEWSNKLSGGTVPVKNGEFQFDMILSKNFTKTAPAALSGYPDKLKLFFYSDDGKTDYGGFEIAPPVQETDPNAPVDDKLPALRLYINDLTFVSGGIVGTTSKFFAFLEDDHGIDLSNVDPDTRLRIEIDGVPYDMDGYYSTIDGDFTKGRIDYLMSNISPGKHSLTLYAADTYGNRATAGITFNVSEKLAAGEFAAFPNPAGVSTQFTFTRSQLEDDMEGAIEIFSTQGLLVAKLLLTIRSKDYRIVLSEWDLTSNGRKVAAGLYLARLTLRSASNSTVTQVSTRLIVYY